MKMKKLRSFACASAIVLTSMLLPTLQGAAEGGEMLGYDISGMIVYNGSQISYYLEEDQTASIVSCGSDLSGDVEIPATIEDRPVSKIAESAFYGIKGLKSITLPKTVHTIENGAFYECTALTDITLSEDLRTIGESAFFGCTALTAIDISDHVMSIPESCFSGCTALENVQFPDDLISVGASAFYNTKCPKELVFPENLNTLGEMAFAYCTGIETVKFSANLINLDNYVFDGCSALQSIEVSADNAAFCSEDGVLFDKGMTKLVKYPAAKKDTKYTVPVGVTALADWSFIGATNLEEIALSNIRTFGEETFYQCSSLKSITLPEELSELPSAIFGYCESLTDVTIPAHCSKIGDYAFMNCTKLKKLTVPATVTEIGKFSFGFAYNEKNEAMEQMKGFRLYTEAGSKAASYAKAGKLKYRTDSKAWLVVLLILAACAVAGLIAFLVYRRSSVAYVGAGPNKGQVISKKKKSTKGENEK